MPPLSRELEAVSFKVHTVVRNYREASVMSQPSIHVLLIEDNPGDAVLVSEYLSESQDPRFEIDHV